MCFIIYICLMNKPICIPLKPITVNQCWQGRRFKTPKYKEWRKAIGWLLNKDKYPRGECEVILDFYIKHYSTTDVDNLIKPTLDALQEHGVIENDKYIVSIRATKHKSVNERIIIQINGLDSMSDLRQDSLL